MPSISRTALVRVVEQAATVLHVEDAAKVEYIARITDRVTVGSYGLGPGCPIRQAEHFFDDSHFLRFHESAFAERFDTLMINRYGKSSWFVLEVDDA